MRASGVLLPISSLPSRYGIGCFSRDAYDFIDQLVKAGQSKWQVLPLDLRVMEILRTSLFPAKVEKGWYGESP